MKILLVILFQLLVFINSFRLLKGLSKEINLVFSVVITLLLSSLLYFFSLILDSGLLLSFGLISVLLLFILILNLYKFKFKFISIRQIFEKFKKIDLIFVFICLFSFLLFINKTQKWGLWDAWAIWSLHAEFLFYPETWKNLFDPALAWNHTDYPLFLPSLIALFWNANGEISSMVPFVIGFIPYFLMIFFFYHAFDKKLFGIICIFLIFIDIGFVTRAASQYADTYLALFILLSYFGLTQSSKDKQNTVFPVLVGIVASGAMWIKNEGLAFYAIFSLLWIFTFINDKKKILLFAAGSSVLIVTIVFFKFLIAPANDVVSTEAKNYTEKLTDVDRYMFIYRYLRDYLLYSVPALTILIITSFFSKSKANILIAISILVIFSSYFVVYILSPYGLQWHLETSADRLVHQLTPAVLLLAIPAAAGFLKKYYSKPNRIS